MFTHDQIAMLSAPLNEKHVKERSQAGRLLPYIEGWHVIDEANRIFGFDAWNRELLRLEQCGEPRCGKDKFNNEQWRVSFIATVRITTQGVFRDGTGYGSGIDKDMGSAFESAVKEAETDAMKRALMTFGNPFGLALYDKTQANVVKDEPEPKKEPEQKKPDISGWFKTAKSLNLNPDKKLSYIQLADKFERALEAAPDGKAVDRLVRDNDLHLDDLQVQDRELCNHILVKIKDRQCAFLAGA